MNIVDHLSVKETGISTRIGGDQSRVCPTCPTPYESTCCMCKYRILQFFTYPLALKTSFHLFITNDCFVVFLQALYKGATRVILATENDYCKLCDASFSSLAVAQAHYQGKNHAKKLRLAEAQQNSSNM